jgi:hypothetical protein
MNVTGRCGRYAALVAVAVVTFVAPARAQFELSWSSPATVTGSSPYPNNEIAYDELDGVYLHVFVSNSRVYGRFLDSTGSTQGSLFAISSTASTFAGWSRVAYSRGSDAGVFLVVYADNRSGTTRPEAQNVWGQLVKYSGTGGQLVGASFAISEQSTNRSVFQEPGRIAFNPNARQFLVPWTDSRGSWDVYARLINVDGSYGAAEVDVSTTSLWQGGPGAAYDWQHNRYIVIYGSDESNGTTGVYANILDGGTSAVIGSRLTMRAGASATVQDMQDAMYLPQVGAFLAYWRYEAGGQSDVVGRYVTYDSTLPGSVFPVIATGTWDGVPDGDYSWSMRKVMVAGQHEPNYAIAVEADGTGTPLAYFRASTTTPGVNAGTYWPNVAAAWNKAQFGLGYILDYATAYVERWSGPTASIPGPHPGNSGETKPTFTDDPLVARVTLHRQVHLTELRQRIDQLRTRYGLAAFSWTDPSPVAGATTVRALHVQELRNALAAVYGVAGRQSPSYTDPILSAGSTVVTTAHVAELRSAVLALW